MIPDGAELRIRPAAPADHDAIGAILQAAYRAGDTYCMPRDMSRSEALVDWFASPFTAFVAEADGRVLGTSHIGRNRSGGGAHVANASFATAPAARGRGIGAALVAHAKDWARAQGFRAMQFNLVAATNERAIRLWLRLGYRVVGTLPGAFRHRRLVFVDALVFYKTLVA